MEQLLRSLPHWNGGRNHILIDVSDSRSLFYDPGHAIVWKSGYDKYARVCGSVSPPSNDVCREHC